MVYRPNVDKQLCFIIMPFAGPQNECYTRIIKPAVMEAGFKAIRSDDIYGTRPIIHDIWQSIWEAQIVIADVTNKNPNVNYELGLCHALGVPTIIISNTIKDVPFDYRHRRCIIYDVDAAGWEYKLHYQLKRTLEAPLSGVVTAQDLSWPYDTFVLELLSPSPSSIKFYPAFISKYVVMTFMFFGLLILILWAVNFLSKEAGTVIYFMMVVVLTGIVLRYAHGKQQ
jgi:hypothetical protein